MSKYDKKIIKKNTGVLSGTVQTHDCDPLMNCKECNGTGTCQECQGRGEVRCHTCHGDRKCTECHGRGRWRCNECGGSGLCRRCHGTGDIECSNCHGSGRVWYKAVSGSGQPDGWKECPKCGGSGKTPCPDCRSGLQTAAKALDVITFGAGRTYGHGSGKCSKCGGTGEIVCKKCHGTGDCQTCHGTGQLTCNHCNGSGNCPRCDHGKVTCERCQGSGSYQTFTQRTTTLYAKRWKWTGSTAYKDIVGAAYGVSLHDGPVKTWKNARQLEADTVDETNKKCEEAMGDEKGLYDEFQEKLGEQTELSQPDQSSDKPYATTMKVQKVPVTKIQYTLNDEQYEVFIIGNNHVVALKSIPTVVKGFELTKWQKIKLAMTEKSRLKAFARLGAYIFQCDGKNMEESAVLEAMVKALQLEPADEAKFKEELGELNTTMPFEQVKKMIKPLLKSKKTISFAWQCMAVDKKVTPQEETLFNQIVSEYDLDNAEIDHLKRMATKFSKLKNDQLAIEYADLSDEFTAIRKKVWKTVIYTASAVALVAAITIFSLVVPKPVPSTNSDSTESADIEDVAEQTKHEADSIAEALTKETQTATEATDQETEETEASADEAKTTDDNTDNEVGDFPETSTRLLTPEDLEGKDKLTLRYMRNEIYARHGYIFKDPELRDHFEHQYWYLGQYHDVSSKLTAIERKNVALIQKYEKR